MRPIFDHPIRGLMLAVVTAAIVSGCASNAPVTPVPAPQPVAKPVATAPVASKPAEDPLPAELSNPQHILYQRSVYFERDQLEPRSSDLALIQAHAQLLASNRRLKVTVFGYTDARGSMEYNLAIGQKRADAVRRLLIDYGAFKSQVKSRSMGEDDAARDLNNEAAQTRSRRAEIRYQGEVER